MPTTSTPKPQPQRPRQTTREWLDEAARGEHVSEEQRGRAIVRLYLAALEQYEEKHGRYPDPAQANDTDAA